MKTVTFYGSSDDNFCVEGEISDEWGCYNRPQQVRLSSGLVVEGEYSPEGYDGKWRVRVVGEVPEGHTVTHVPATDDEDDNSDQLYVTGTFDSIINPVLTSREIAVSLKEREWQHDDDEVLLQVAKIVGIQ